LASTSPDTWAAAAEDYLRDRIPRLLPGAPTVARILPLTEDVWQVDLRDGRSLVAKHQIWGFLAHGEPYDLLQVEKQVLGLLGGEGCPVPKVLGLDPEGQVILLEHCGSHTLEDVDSTPYIPQVIDGLLQIERAFEKYQDLLAWRVVPQATLPCLRQAWAEAADRARQGLEQFGRHCHGAPTALAGAQQALDEILSWLTARPPALGATDYRPRNIVVDPAGSDPCRVRFIEFAKIGWDWTERRLVQYTNTVRRGFRRLLDAGDVEFYAVRAGRERARALDYHHLVFYLNAASMLGAALAAPSAHAPLLRAWGPAGPRLRQLAELMAAPLSDDPAANLIREVFKCRGDS